MTSVTFPSSQDHLQHSSGSRHHSNGDSQFYSAAFDTSASFTMNPLSSHPPRTPRTSIISNNNTAGFGTAYDTKEALESEAGDAVEESLIDEEEDRMKEAESRVRKEDVWREMFLTSYGRDKAFKIIQYSIRVYLLFHGRISVSRLWTKRPQLEIELVKGLTSTASGLSKTRKTLLLFNWLQPLTEIMSQQSVPFSAEQTREKTKEMDRPFLHMLLYAPPPVLLELVNAIADDVATWSRLGLFGKKMGERAGRISDWCWFLSTLVGLTQNTFERQVITSRQHEVEGRLYNESMTGATAKSKPESTKIDEKELARLQKQDYWLQVSRAKLAMDLIFVSYELFYIKRARDTVKAFAGLSSAILSSAKAYNRHKSSLLKSALSG